MLPKVNSISTIINKYVIVVYKQLCASHVGKYNRADDRPKLAMLAANVGYRYWTDDRSSLG